jgi:hypothetical protein
MNRTYKVSRHKARGKVTWHVIFCAITFLRSEIICYVPSFAVISFVRLSAITYIEGDYIVSYRLCWASEICTGKVTVYLIIIFFYL